MALSWVDLNFKTGCPIVRTALKGKFTSLYGGVDLRGAYENPENSGLSS